MDLRQKGDMTKEQASIKLTKDTSTYLALKRAQTILKPLLCEHVVGGPWSQFLLLWVTSS